MYIFFCTRDAPPREGREALASEVKKMRMWGKILEDLERWETGECGGIKVYGEGSGFEA